ncbi:hypothetical protein PSHT_03067 [Puccinia striiformis]|uniref:N-acetyltransferase domain-containing protein n=1 Tax=Puccinia striiformis TaxID=27350 RepID=A0A2S4WGP0_9BASI|nr:hypothetical protein PSHT_03067 [Puccinia striiformis]
MPKSSKSSQTSKETTKDASRLEKSTDIRSFFASATAPHARASPSTRSPLGSSQKLSKPYDKSIKTHRPMSQLLLDLSNQPTTQICKECGMSFVLGVEEDMEIHKKHHRRVLNGIEWPMTPFESQPDSYRVVWRDPSGMDLEKIIKISLEPSILKRSRYKHKVEQILEMVNRSLDAQELTEEQLKASYLYIYIGTPLDQPDLKKRRTTNVTTKTVKKKLVVKAMCVAARIEVAYQIVRGPGTPGEEEIDDTELLRFGETTSNYIARKPKPETSLVGIHRIWSSPYHRRRGLCRRLLDSVADTFIYGMSIDRIEDRRRSIAFSQPTESGMRLASNWFQSVLFKIFID